MILLTDRIGAERILNWIKPWMLMNRSIPTAIMTKTDPLE